MSPRPLLGETLRLTEAFLDGLPQRPVRAGASREQMLATLGGPLPDQGQDALEVVRALAAGVEPGLIASAGPRYFGFVIGGSVPASLAADWLTTAWDQNAGVFATSPAASVVEEIAAGWLLELLQLPRTASVGFVTGAQMANFTGLAAARHAVLQRAGWDVEEEGLIGAPPINVVLGEEAHATIFQALRMLGLGRGRAIRVPADEQGRMRPSELRRILAACQGPTIVCAQAGNVNSGAFDPLHQIAEAARERQAWVHVDGAFGLWAATSPDLRPLVRGAEAADSWATDAHKWLNVPYDSGLVMVADPAAHRAAMTVAAPYLPDHGKERDGLDWAPEFSRRARGFTVYAALRSLGGRGVAALIQRCCHLARRMADRLAAAPGVRVLNDVVLNQVLVRFEPAQGGDADAYTRSVIARVQAEGTCWLGGTTWHGQAAMRISLSNWSTSEADIDASADAILRMAASTG